MLACRRSLRRCCGLYNTAGNLDQYGYGLLGIRVDRAPHTDCPRQPYRWFDGPAHAWWLGALGVVLVERIATFTYFIPTMIWLQQQGGMSPEVSSTLAAWSSINHGRHVLTISAWLLSLKALSLLSTARHTSGNL